MSATGPTQALTAVSDLIAPGVPLPFRVLDAQGRLLLAEGQCVMDLRQLQALLERGACVTQEEVQAERARRAAAGGGSPVMSTRKLTWFDRWERHLWSIDETLRALGRGGDAREALAQLVDQQMAFVAAQPDAALFTLLRQDDRRFALYALGHARHTATLVQLTTGVLGWPAERVRSAVAAALTMNAAIVELQAKMAEQPDPASKKQIDQIRLHPARAAELLRGAAVDDAEWLAAVQDHHERADGSGYPRGITDPGEMARVLRAADVFAAKISPRAIRAALPPQAAARQLFQEEQGSSIAGALIKAVGLYPPGDLVRLKNGEAGVVVRRKGAALEVAVLLAASGQPVSGLPRRDTAVAEHAIAGPLLERAGLPRLLPETVFGLVYLE
jgi:HD-GYP domain-containing protein (c-di-GMP phosphodiesterase class II)